VTGRADLTDQQWAVLESLLPRGKKPGRPPKWSSRQFIDGIRWRVRVGSPWRDVSPQYGPWQTVYGLFRQWQRDGTWRAILTGLQARADAYGLITWDVSIDSTAALTHQHAAGCGKGGPVEGTTRWDRHRTRRSCAGLFTWRLDHQAASELHLSCEQGRKPLSILISAGQRGDSPQLTAVIERIRVPRPGVGRHGPAESGPGKAYSSKANRAYLCRRGIKATIPIKDDQAAHRRRLDAKGGRPPAFDTQVYKQPRCGVWHQLAQAAPGGGDSLRHSVDDAACARRLVGLTLASTGTDCLELELSTLGWRTQVLPGVGRRDPIGALSCAAP
jgi:transposase